MTPLVSEGKACKLTGLRWVRCGICNTRIMEREFAFATFLTFVVGIEKDSISFGRWLQIYGYSVTALNSLQSYCLGCIICSKEFRLRQHGNQHSVQPATDCELASLKASGPGKCPAGRGRVKCKSHDSRVCWLD